MAFQQFTFPRVVTDLGLKLREGNLFEAVEAEQVRPELLAQLIEGSNLAGAINTEKARSEFVIAPVLFELKHRHANECGLFSGVEIDADSTRGLHGICDFLITKSPIQHVVQFPIITVVEAKNDNLRTGFGQCIASMVATQFLNVADGKSSRVYGAVTLGNAWKFLKLEQADLTLDMIEYSLEHLGKIIGILGYMIRTA